MNEFSKQVITHSIQSAASNVIMDWNNAADDAFSQWKHDYNKEYYETHKDQWEIYNNPELKKELEDKIKAATGEMTNQAIDTATNAVTNYFEEHKDEIAKKAVDSLEVTANSAISVGKEILNEIGRRAKDSWNIGVDTLMNKAKKAKSEFQSAFNSGMDSIISGVKSFASLWKSGW